MNKSLSEKFKRLQSWTDSLAFVVGRALPDMEEILDGKVKLPGNCPSPEVAAAMELRQVEKKLAEVTAAVKDIKQTLRVRPELN